MINYGAVYWGIRELESIAKLLSRQFDISVRIGNPASDKKTIYLPLTDAKIFEAPYERKVHGYLDHEAAHIIWSDFKLVEKLVTSDKDPSGLLKQLWNLYEDRWIEGKISERFPGSKDNLEQANNFVVQDQAKNFGKDALNDIFFILCYTNKGYEIPYASQELKDLVQLEFGDLMRRSGLARSSRDNLVLAEETLEILKRLLDLDSKTKKSGQDGQQGDFQSGGTSEMEDGVSCSGVDSQQGSSGQKSPKSQSGEGSASDANSGASEQSTQGDKQGGSGKDQKKQQQSKDKSGNSGGNAKSDKEGKGDDKKELDSEAKKRAAEQKLKDMVKDSPSRNEVIDSLMGKMKAPEVFKTLTVIMRNTLASQSAGSKASGIPFSYLYDTVSKIDKPTDAGIKHYNECHKLVQDSCRVTRPRFIMSVKGQSEERLLGEMKRGPKLDSRNLSKVVSENSQRIFSRYVEDITADVAISTMIDSSSSMDSQLVTAISLSILDPLSYTEAKTYVASFHGAERRRIPNAQRSSVHITVFKDWNERYINIKTRLGQVQPTGYTPMVQALDYAYLSIAKRPEKRRMIILITDGFPDGNADAFPFLRGRENFLIKSGVELVVVVIGENIADGLRGVFSKIVKVPVRNGDVQTKLISQSLLDMLNLYFKPYILKQNEITMRSLED